MHSSDRLSLRPRLNSPRNFQPATMAPACNADHGFFPAPLQATLGIHALAGIDRARKPNAHRRLSQAQAIDYLRDSLVTESGLEKVRLGAHICGMRSVRAGMPMVEVTAPDGTKSVWAAAVAPSAAVEAVNKMIPPDHVATLSNQRLLKQRACAEARYGKSNHDHTPNALATPASSLHRSTDARAAISLLTNRGICFRLSRSPPAAQVGLPELSNFEKWP